MMLTLERLGLTLLLFQSNLNIPRVISAFIPVTQANILVRTCPCIVKQVAHFACPWHAQPESQVTDSLLAGTEAPWRWNNLPGSPAGTQRWVSPLGLSSNTSASVHGGILDTLLGTASCNHAPPGPAPPGSPCLEDQVNEIFVYLTTALM